MANALKIPYLWFFNIKDLVITIIICNFAHRNKKVIDDEILS